MFFIGSGLILLNRVNQSYLVEVPERGGTLNEGVIGTPRSINPLLATSETDRALTNLIYSGLLRSTSEGLITDLASRYEVSEDLLEYRFFIREDAKFHDGTPVTADDIIFTIDSAQNTELRSPKRANWEGIRVEKISDQEIIFNLDQPYPPFLQNMTLGILPKHIWDEISFSEFSLSNFNISPVGSGPYKISKINRDDIGIPSSYNLESFDNFVLGEPLIRKMNIFFAKNQDELIELYQQGGVNSIYGINPKNARGLQIEGKNVKNFPLPRVFGLFLNQNESPVLANREVREALQLATPKNQIVDEVLYGFGTSINSPVPSHLLQTDLNSESINFDPEEALDILLEAGWETNEDGILINDDTNQMLSIAISTNNIPELNQAAEIVAEAWREIGIDVEIKIYTPSDLNSNVIRPRDFAVLLFGLVIDKDLDFYAFWHSSQRTDPGLNITSYANIDVDNALEDFRNTADPELIREELELIESEIIGDIPAIFLYSPNFIYVIPNKLEGLSIDNIATSEERFSNVYQWHIETAKVWEVFAE